MPKKLNPTKITFSFQITLEWYIEELAASLLTLLPSLSVVGPDKNPFVALCTAQDICMQALV